MKKPFGGSFSGFTLIELLVVVLIIGILAAVALPKYQTAVQKSRYATLMPLAKSVKNAEESVLMANGKYTMDLAELSVDFGGGTVSENKVTDSNGTTLEVNAGDTHEYVKASKEGVNNTYVMYFTHSSNFPEEIHCEALKDDKVAQSVCLSYAPKNADSPIAGTDSNYDAYILQGTGAGTGTGSSSGSSWGYSWIVSWEEEEQRRHSSFKGYDENGKLVASLDYCETGDITTCSEGFYYLKDEKGNDLATMECYGFDSNGICTDPSTYGDQVSTYDDNGKEIFRKRCTDVDWGGGSCSNYTIIEIDHENFRNDSSNFPSRVGARKCDVSDGVTCLGTWGEWYDF